MPFLAPLYFTAERIKDVLEVVRKYADSLERKEVDAEELAVRKKLSREPGSYETSARTAVAAEQLEEAGVKLHAGQLVTYVVTDANAENPKFRVKPLRLLERESKYDGEWYLDRLAGAAEEILSPFGFTEDRIESAVLRKGEQGKLGLA